MKDISEAIADLITALQTYAPLAAFCQEKWGKELQVKQFYKKRTELSVSDDLPIIMVIWLGVDEGDVVDDHTIRLYGVFNQDDKGKGAAETIAFQGLIKDAILVDVERNKYALYTRKGGVATDEGKFHPVYASTRDIVLEMPAY